METTQLDRSAAALEVWAEAEGETAVLLLALVLGRLCAKRSIDTDDAVRVVEWANSASSGGVN